MTTATPPQPSTTEAPGPRGAGSSPQIRRKLRQAWRKGRRFAHLRGALLVLMWAAVLVLVTLLIDWLLLLPGWGRLLLLVVNVGALGWVGYRQWWRRLEGFDAVRMALRVERQHPELASLLVSYVQFEGKAGGGGRGAASDALVASMCEQAIERTGRIDFREIFDATELRRLGMYCAGVLVVFTLIGVNWSDAMRVLGTRMLNPRADIGYPTRTQIEHVTGDIVVRQGDAAELRVVAGGVIPAQATLLLRSDAEAVAERMTVEREAGEDGAAAQVAGTGARYGHELGSVYESFEYAFEVGDTRSAWHAVRVSTAPRIVSSEVALEYPAYTLMDAETVDAMHLEVPVGTRIAWRFELDRPASDAALLIDVGGEDAEPVAMELAEGGRVLTLEHVAQASFGYRLWRRWTDGGEVYERREPVRYFVYAVPNDPPVVDLLSPRRDVPGTLRRRLDLAFAARDAYGLSEAWIVYRRNGGDERRHELGEVTGRSVEEEYTWRPGQVVEGRAEGDILEFAIEFADTYDGEDGPNVGRSATRRLIVMGEAEYLRYIAQQRRRLMEDVASVREEEAEALEEVETMRRDTESRP